MGRDASQVSDPSLPVLSAVCPEFWRHCTSLDRTGTQSCKPLPSSKQLRISHIVLVDRKFTVVISVYIRYKLLTELFGILYFRALLQL